MTLSQQSWEVKRRPCIVYTAPMRPGFSTVLGDIRSRHGWSLQEVGAAAGKSNQAMSTYEREQIRPPLDILPVIAKAMNCTDEERKELYLSAIMAHSPALAEWVSMKISKADEVDMLKRELVAMRDRLVTLHAGLVDLDQQDRTPADMPIRRVADGGRS
jgi:transcriptional regulator with XRE-family HTH domain